jgi:hypothetical protein
MDDLQRELMRGSTATMMAVVTVAGIFAEVLVRKGVLTADEARGALCAMAEEIRDDVDVQEHKGKSSPTAAFGIAGALDSRAIGLQVQEGRK